MGLSSSLIHSHVSILNLPTKKNDQELPHSHESFMWAISYFLFNYIFFVHGKKKIETRAKKKKIETIGQKKAITEMVPDPIWAPDFFGPQEIWAPHIFGP